MKKILNFADQFLKEKLKLAGKIFLYTFLVIVIVLLLYILSKKWDRAIFDVVGWDNPDSIWFNFFIFSIVLLIGALLTLIFVKRITANLKEIARASELIGNGDLTSKEILLKKKRFPDETDELSDSINQMLCNLKDLVSLLKKTSGRIHESSDFLMKSVENLNNYGRDLNVFMTEILNGAKVQKDMVKVAIDNIRNMANIIADSAERARNASNSMLNANKTAVTGEELAKEAIDRMKTIFDQVEASGKAVSNFVEKFNQINKMVEFITGVAQKTNLLALNASIEAARAGEMGKGFAIVAEEIRKLAGSTSKSANQISELVRLFGKESEEILSSIKSSMNGIEENRLDVGIIINSLENIVKNVGEVSSKVNDITRLSQDQTSLVENVVTSSESVLGIAEKNTHQIVQMSTVFNKEIEAIEKMRGNAQNMSDLSGNLQGIVSKFKTEDKQ